MTDFDCRKCKEKHYWKEGCVGFEWYDPPMIIYCRTQIIWLIDKLLPEEYGDWPDNPAETRDTGHKPLQPRAYYEVACAIVADVRSRLERTGDAGQTLEHEIREGLTEFSPPAKKALNYITGWRKKRTGFAVWKAETKRGARKEGKSG